MEFFTDPVAMSLLGKAAGAVIIFFLVIGFIPGIVVGWLLGKAT